MRFDGRGPRGRLAAAGLTGLGVGGEAGLIAWQAHLGGYLAGLFLAGPFDKLRPRLGII